MRSALVAALIAVGIKLTSALKEPERDDAIDTNSVIVPYEISPRHNLYIAKP